MKRALTTILAAALWAPSASAWDSQCYHFNASGQTQQCAPTNVADGRLRGGHGINQDEHRQIYERAARAAGLPTAALQDHSLLSFPGVTRLAPVPFAMAQRTIVRTMSVDEFAMLPDFSYTLDDWARANESCPSDPSAATLACHSFQGHMGALNANHFPPQAQRWYLHYHELAVNRAQACSDLTARLGTAARYDMYRTECEREALVLEGIAQHYLQDQWSVGHMWERWGSTSLGRSQEQNYAGNRYRLRVEVSDVTFTREIDRMLGTGAVAGMIHGMQPMLAGFAYALEGLGLPGLDPLVTDGDIRSGTCDTMCCPDNDTQGDIQFHMPGGGLARGAGDDHADKVFGGDDARFAMQGAQALSCAAMSLRAVYEALGTNPALGSLGPATGISGVNPTGAECTGMRATNRALYTGLAAGTNPAHWISMMARKRLALRVALAHTGQATSATFGAAELEDLTALAESFVHWNRENPTGTEASRLQPMPGSSWNSSLFGSAPNRMNDDLPTWIDQAAGADSAQARLFHRGHVADHCSMTESDLLALRQTGNDICAEFVARHLRFGTASDYDHSVEPVCGLLGGTMVYGSRPSTPPPADGVALESFLRTQAEEWCRGNVGCGDLANCSDCVRHAGCGWCGSGLGECMNESNLVSDCSEPISDITMCTDCSANTCSQCLTDSHCGWCPGNNTCGNAGRQSFVSSCSGALQELPSQCGQ